AQELHISAASAYELAQKSRIGKLPQASAILARWDELAGAMGAHELSLTAADMATAGSLSWDHRDPFDRMLVAQARLRGLTLVTSDTAVREFDGVVCADWV
ncbi:type II toxin-antitoxin system VapC family toxin, partial [uncultured Agrococcus sp.]|uniref:type II toxin-antitoxin system VapC family toxin n=1 Tax=uncultured Agrococcus sp. TaxID=382258 RepID=UPI0025E2D6A9